MISMDLSVFDRSEFLEIIFPLAYSPFYMNDHPSSLATVRTLSVEVELGVLIECAFWATDKAYPTIILFHGNGETAVGYDWLAPFYLNCDLNLLVTEYRGYGLSKGKPTIANMLDDALVIFKFINEYLRNQGYVASLFVAGRSLGSIPALEVACHYQAEINGLIIESGTANNFQRLWKQFGITEEEVGGGDRPFLNKIKIRRIEVATLIIHGCHDMIIPVDEGKELYQNSGAHNKKIRLLAEAGHNDIIAAYKEDYFRTIKEFVRKYR
jgi:alpha-beta hydrolase superfamily lysophospholipase